VQQTIAADQQSNSMFVPEIQEGRQGPVLAPHAEGNKKLSYYKNKVSCAEGTPTSCVKNKIIKSKN
jgi:hypothetical protein